MASSALNQACITTYGAEFDPSAGVIRNGAGLAFLANTMRAEGWCESSITLLRRIGGREFLYLGYSHGSYHIPGFDHSSCKDFCISNRVDTKTYEPRHTKAGCSCDLIEVDRNQVESIIDSGGIPVCRIITTSDNEGVLKPFLEVAPACKERQYVAISHVWAHGLGNPRRNGLPTCAALKIQKDVSNSWRWLAQNNSFRGKQEEYGHDHGFWMDTFCVPIHPSSKHLRKKAIAQMKEIYGGALAVQVVDHVLQMRPTRMDPIETIMATSLSPWLRRLWTLQEAVLAKRIHLLLEGGKLADADTTFGNCMRSIVSTTIDSSNFNCRLFSEIPRFVLSLWISIRPYALSSGSSVVRINAPPTRTLDSSSTNIDSARIATVLSQLPLRSTTRQSDETICVSTLLGLNVATVLEVEADSEEETCEKRMIKLLTSISIIPASLAFSTGPKMSTPGFRWAPQTLLQNDTGEPSTTVEGTQAKVLESKGLVCKLDAFILSPRFANDDLVNADEFLLFETGHVSHSPIRISHPSSGDYLRTKQQLTCQDYEGHKPLLVLLFAAALDEKVGTMVILGVVRKQASVDAFRSDLQRGSEMYHNPQTTQVQLSEGASTVWIRFEPGHGGDELSGPHVMQKAEYETMKVAPGEIWQVEEEGVEVEFLKVMVATRFLSQTVDAFIRAPATLVQGRRWTLT